MFAVFKTQIRKELRSPWALILLLVGSIVLTLIFANIDQDTSTTVPIFSTEEKKEEVLNKWEPLLNKNSNFNFVVEEDTAARKLVEEGEHTAVLQLFEHDYRLITNSSMPAVQMLEDYVHMLFTTEAQLQAAAGNNNVAALRAEVESYLQEAPLQIQTEALDGGEVPDYNMGLQLLFGFTLFMAMFTIGFQVNAVSADRANGVWDRMILSPISKTAMYTGHLCYSFFIGFLQVGLVFLIFRYILHYDLGGHLGMILFVAAIFSLSMVSVAMLFTGFIKTPEQFQVIYSSVIPIIPVISGVYMPPGTLSNPILLFIADLFPLQHAMNSLMDIALYGAGWDDIALQIAFMLLIGVICMGVGINLIERRNN
ncbi:ABC transporter permease [Gracilibacillus alcaliphilus]|uniref:ABC transporter permease n=1 Tax=Gracilibacillus alcaliphilus TaxID=1401441 RepID=UPI00195E5754|nr:ABC transporter permease [Gracilibacillus alcaliphilus]MBM7679445.1 ABC-2 type transport system permease protein [Gracilibacillus alcaliphilus]